MTEESIFIESGARRQEEGARPARTHGRAGRAVTQLKLGSMLP